jgi:feruloyl esterase
MGDRIRFTVLAVGTIGVLGIASAPAYAALSCTVQGIQSAAPKDTTIVSAEKLATPVPHCKVDGYVTTTNPGPNQVNFRLQLPDKDKWAKRYYFVGLGGTAGYVPTDSQIPAGNPMQKGFAVAGTDTGHQFGSLNWSFLGQNPGQTLDHVRRGAHVTAVATQQITKAYYDADKFYRYHSGCSGGGRMGTEAITNYPGDYDGVLVGEPGLGPKFGSETMLAFIHMAQQLNREPGAFLTPAKLMMLDKKVTEHCDAKDGAKDGVVWEHEVCSYDFKQLLCKSGDGPECLTAPELKSVEAIAAGPHDTRGKIKDGFPITNMSTWSTFIGSVPPPWSTKVDKVRPDQGLPKASIGYTIGDTIARAFFGPDFDSLKDFDFNNQKQVDHYWEMAKKLDYGDAFSTDLKGVQKAGAKLIFWNGVSAPCCLDQDLLKYYKTAAESVGGLPQFQKFASFYKVPGIGHCGGGTGSVDHADRLFESLIAWVEEGKAPGRIVAHRGDRSSSLFADPLKGSVAGVAVPPATGSPRDFLLCPYPTIAKFNGKAGGESEAVNWTCK